MKATLGFIACLTFSVAAWSQQTVTEFDWKDFVLTGPPREVVPIVRQGRVVLRIENTNDGPFQTSVFTFAKPKISAAMYAVQGEIRYDAVQGDGFLEMWSHFPPVKPGLPEGEYFSRTMGESGEMGKIRGTSDWRPFSLPFDSTGGSGPPTKLQINLILGGRGTVYLGPLKLVQYPAATTASNGGSGNAWWSNHMAGLVGGWGGIILGCMGGLIGTLCGMGKGRGFVVALIKMQIGLGILLVVAGIVAFVRHQPYAVWYPLLLPAIVLLAVYSRSLSIVDKRYQEQELRRMQSLDA
jgi:hypothetical protein